MTLRKHPVDTAQAIERAAYLLAKDINRIYRERDKPMSMDELERITISLKVLSANKDVIDQSANELVDLGNFASMTNQELELIASQHKPEDEDESFTDEEEDE